ncbi:TRAP transporter substrate-binding protein DctP [Thermodesulfobacteriota bacterium]
MKCLKLAIFVFLGIMLITIPFSTTLAQEKPIELKYGAAFGVTHAFSKADKAYIQKIKDETGNRVIIKPYWGSTIIKQREAIEQVIKGVCDIAFITPGFASAGFPISKSMMGLFYGLNDSKTGLKLYKQIYNKFPEVSAEFSQLKVLQLSPLYSYALLTRKKPVRTVADLKGLRLKCPSAFAKAFKDLGVEGVLMPMSEAYVSLEKGLLDGLFAPLETLKSFRFAEVVKYVTTNIGCTSSSFPKRAMNQKTWNSLPADIQKVFDANVDFWTLEELKYFIATEKEAIAFSKKEKVEFIKLPNGELKKIIETMTVHAKDTAAKLDAKGIKGTEIFKEIRRLAAQNM